MRVRFSILVPTYNRRDLVRETIDSVLRQTFTNYELFVIDDGSTDRTIEVLKSYGTRIKIIQQHKQGPEVARNVAAARSQGEYLVLLDSDDLFFPSSLAVYEQVIRAFDAPPLILGSVFRFADRDTLPRESENSGRVEIIMFRDYVSKTVPLPGCISLIVVKKAVFDAIGGMRSSTPLTFHNDDFNLLLKTTTYGPCVAVRWPYTIAYRLHDGNSVKNIQSIAEGLLNTAQTERRGGYPGGSKRRWDRYATIGGQAAAWAYRYCWCAGQRKLALRLLHGTAPMVLVAMCRKLVRRFRAPAQIVTLSDCILGARDDRVGPDKRNIGNNP